jgi:hypothetical protein
MAEQTETGTEQTSSSGSRPPEDPVTPVDAFILFNEREDAVPAIVEELSSRGITTYFWRRDIGIGQLWEEIERAKLSAATTVVIFLGSQGWGPFHRQLALEAQKNQKRTIPVLIGDPPAEAFEDADGVFKSRRYLDLRAQTPAALRALVDAIRPRERGQQLASIISSLVDGNEEQRSAVLQEVRKVTFVDRRGLSDRLRDQISNRFSPAQDTIFESDRDPKEIPSIRSWMLSVLIWTDAEYQPNRELILKHLDHAYETERNVRFWALAGLYQCHASYIEIAAEICIRDSGPEVARLASVIRNPDDPKLIDEFRSQLLSDNFEYGAWPILRVLRVVPIPILANDLCQILDRSAGSRPLAYDALYALANPPMAAEAAPILHKTPGIDNVIYIIVDVLRNSDAGATRQFARLLASFDPAEIEAALARAETGNPEALATIRSLRRHVRELALSPTTPRSSVAGFRPDTYDVKQDDLDIREDVQTLTAVMLAKDVPPPLAIGLFGDWGSGKSFFMDSMKAVAERIANDAAKKPNPAFCAEIVQIKFNAWHYADTNLWASLVSHILESLAQHVSPRETPEKQQARLVGELGSAKQVRSQIEDEQKITEKQIADRQGELQKLRLERGQKEIELRDLRLNDLQALFSENSALRTELKTALEEAGVPTALTSFSDLNQAVSEANSLRGRVTGLATGLFRSPKGLLIALLVAIVLVLPTIGYWFHQHFKSEFVFLGTVIAEIAAFIGGIATLLSKASGYVKTALDKVETAKQQVDKALAKKRETTTVKEAELQKQITTLKVQEEQVTSRLRAATEKVIDLERQIAALTESRSLARFLTERAKSDDYRKHLGVISTIRQDFEALTRQLIKPEETPGSNLRKVERIILYVDDLDRCPADKVVDVLQAVHLLLAYPLFVVVVGVDPRWLSHSLTTTYGALKGTGELSSDEDLWRTTPQNYLEKIFQVPFSLRPMTSTGYTKLIQGLFSPDARSEPSVQRQSPPAHASRPAHVPEPKQDQVNPPQTGTVPLPEIAGAEKPQDKQPAPDAPPEPALIIHDDALVIKTVERTFAARLYSLLPTPRATKRFSNTYRILKAPIPLGQLDAFEGTEHAPGTFQVPMLLLAILIGMPSEAAILFPRLFDRAAKGEDPVVDLEGLKIPGFEKDVPPAIREIARIVAESTFPHTPALFVEWFPRVSRFSFEIGRTIKPAFVSQNQT